MLRGSQRDEGANSNTIALVAAGLGISILVVGLLALKGEKPASSGVRVMLLCQPKGGGACLFGAAFGFC